MNGRHRMYKLRQQQRRRKLLAFTRKDPYAAELLGGQAELDKAVDAAATETEAVQLDGGEQAERVQMGVDVASGRDESAVVTKDSSGIITHGPPVVEATKKLAHDAAAAVREPRRRKHTK